jgi:glycogen synthase
MAKDCPDHAIMVDDSELPQGDDDKFFNAWQLNNGVVTVNMEKAKSDYLTKYNNAAIQVAQTRHLNTLTGIPNTIDDTTWLSRLTADRVSISNAKTTSELLAIALPTS